ncbi:MAG: ribosome biogenesis GTPase Der [Candidatus Microthrix sp.]|nr:ribosome biogenesis GTPase Der [Candidatus Microthrix sp.]MBK9559777.1 ribosome biogenesis GTPase Der [Candidatus Microthrix sp.]
MSTSATPNTTAGDGAPPDASLARVAIVGRPNVGKSTLLNRIIGRREAIVEERPGVTRDRHETEASWAGRRFVLIDTGGWSQRGDDLDAKVSAQSEAALDEADVILLIVDATVGSTDDDDQVAGLIRRRSTPVLVVANKVDDTGREPLIWDFLGLGLGDPFPISALHGRGTGDLLDAIVDLLPEGVGIEPGPVEERAPWEPFVDSQAIPEDDPDEPLLDHTTGKEVSVALVGRPNVGKSTLFNRLIGSGAVVHDMPGTTRDSVDTVVDTDLGALRFIDTAGMRRRARVDTGTEYFSMVRALRSVDTANIALLVIDATEGVTHQDQRLAERIDAAGCPIAVILNKWELLSTEARHDVTWQVGQKLHFIGESPVLRISALTGKGVQRILPALESAIDAYQTRIPTRLVNEAIRAAQQAQPAPHGARVLYATQGATQPPTFTLFANRDLPTSYVRYLERSLRERFGLEASPIKLRVKRRD